MGHCSVIASNILEGSAASIFSVEENMLLNVGTYLPSHVTEGCHLNIHDHCNFKSCKFLLERQLISQERLCSLELICCSLQCMHLELAQNWLIACHGSELISINDDSLVVISCKIQARFECVRLHCAVRGIWIFGQTCNACVC